MENILSFLQEHRNEWALSEKEGAAEIFELLGNIVEMVEEVQGELIDETKECLQKSISDSEKLGHLIQIISFATDTNFCLNCGCIVKVGPYCPACDREITVHRIAAEYGLETKSVIPSPPQENAEITEMQYMLNKEHDEKMLDDWKRERAEDEESRFDPYAEYGVSEKDFF